MISKNIYNGLIRKPIKPSSNGSLYPNMILKQLSLKTPAFITCSGPEPLGQYIDVKKAGFCKLTLLLGKWVSE